jgi:hypothetical protein
MTKKQYRSAMGKTVDMGSLLLQNENVRAVGNMSVNARGDVLDSKNRVIDRKNQQIKRQQRRQTGVSTTPVSTSVAQVKSNQPTVESDLDDVFDDLPEDNDVVATTVNPTAEALQLSGGLAAAIAKSRTVTQELEKPLNSKPTSLRKI